MLKQASCLGNENVLMKGGIEDEPLTPSMYRMMKLIFQITLFAAVLLSACVCIPEKHFIVSQRGDIGTAQEFCDCDIARLEKTPARRSMKRPELDSSGFRLMNWNMQKGM
jgi:hypothetical protein